MALPGLLLVPDTEEVARDKAAAAEEASLFWVLANSAPNALRALLILRGQPISSASSPSDPYAAGLFDSELETKDLSNN